MLIFFSVAIFAAEGNKSTIPIAYDIDSQVSAVRNNTCLTHISKLEIYKQCSVTSSGTVQTENMAFTLVLTVTGPCNSSLAQKMRDAIATVRAAFK